MSLTTIVAASSGAVRSLNAVVGPDVAPRRLRLPGRLPTIVLAVWLIALVLSAFAVYMAVDDWDTHYRRAATRVLLSVPVSLPDLPSGEVGYWGSWLTMGVSTSVSYDRQQLSMATVQVDPHLDETTCREYSWSPGVADPVNGLVCLGEGYWKPNLRTYYLLAHELAHIALSDFGEVHEGLGHGAAHSQLTLTIMFRLLEREGVPAWKVAAAERGVEFMRSRCHSAYLC